MNEKLSIYWTCRGCSVIEWTSQAVKSLIHQHDIEGPRGRLPELFLLQRHIEKPLEGELARTS